MLGSTAQLCGRLEAEQFTGGLRLGAGSGAGRSEFLGLDHLGRLWLQIAGVGFTVRRFKTWVL